MPKKITTQDFIKASKEAHPGKFTYERTVYIKSKVKVTVTCVTHGDIEVWPNPHVNGRDCLDCINDSKRDSQDKFIEKSKDKHPGKFTYHNTVYLNGHSPVTITCIRHGDFTTWPSGHLDGKGCRECFNERRSIAMTCSPEDYIVKAKLKHGAKYDYSKTKYTVAGESITATCFLHGDFEVNSSGHLSGSGCDLCGAVRLSNYPDKLYLAYSPSLHILKIGITSDVNKRLYSLKCEPTKDFFIVNHKVGFDPNQLILIEYNLIKFIKNKYPCIEEKFPGYTECVYCTDINEAEKKIYAFIESGKHLLKRNL